MISVLWPVNRSGTKFRDRTEIFRQLCKHSPKLRPPEEAFPDIPNLIRGDIGSLDELLSSNRKGEHALQNRCLVSNSGRLCLFFLPGAYVAGNPIARDVQSTRRS